MGIMSVHMSVFAFLEFKEDKVGSVCRMYQGEKYTQGICGEVGRKKTKWKTKAQMEG